MHVRLSAEQKIKILNSTDVYAVMQQVLLRENKIRRGQEHFWVVGLNNANKILFIELVSLGASNRVGIDPPEVFRMAIYKLATKIVLVHNHPSGEIKPSNDDIHFTDRMLKSGQMLRIEVIDHLIITDKKYASFGDLGIMEQVRNSGFYELLDNEKVRLQEFKAEMELKKAQKSKSLDIAKKMKEDGMDIDTIKKYTGLNKWEIKKL